MNKIWQLFDEEFVLDYFRRKLLPLYPAFKEIGRVEIKPYKKLIWETTYHVVIGFNVYFLAKGKKEIKIPIICSAHSDEARDNVFIGLNYLWEKKMNRGGIDLPRPLFFSQYFNGTFYRALNGENLLHYIINKDQASVAEITREAAELFARLHALPAGPEANFNPLNARIQTVIPGTAMIFSEMRARYHGKYTPTLEKIYDILTKREAVFFDSGEPLSLIHGDAHPENIIKTGEERIGLIDFTDLCLSDFARDLGAFIQQVEYKIIMKIGDQKFADEIKTLFLETYLQATGRELNASLRERIDLYYNWTAVRSATYWFLKAGHNEERGEALLNIVKNNLKI